MPAYAKSIEYSCLACSAKATREVFNRFNASVGTFCKKHALLRIRELNALEAKIESALENKEQP